MSERQESYVIVAQPVTITITKEWADFLKRAQTARNDWRQYHCVDHIAIIDWRNLDLKVVKS